MSHRPSAHDVDNTQDVIDTRTILERINWLDEDSEEDREELALLTALIEEVRNMSGDSPEDGAELIRESYFEDYARQTAEDIGAIKGAEGWPLNCIDWEKAARELQYDYSTVDYDGVTYYVRS